MRQLVLISLLIGQYLTAHAQEVIKLYPGKAPGSESWTWQEALSVNNAFKTRQVYNVATPTLTVYLPDPATATGVGIVVAPGGGFHTLAIDSEGIEVAKWLNRKGIAAFVLKYRLVRSLTDDPVAETMAQLKDMKQFDEMNAPVVALAIADGRQAIDYVRSHAAQYKLRSDRIGLMGFSAGGTVTMGVGFAYSTASRPDFLVPVYPYLSPRAIAKQDVPADAPPIFICAATDDQLGLAPHSTKLYNDWIAAQKPAELHMYAKGGHGFGMNKQKLPVDTWIERFYDWLVYLGYTKQQ